MVVQHSYFMIEKKASSTKTTYDKVMNNNDTKITMDANNNSSNSSNISSGEEASSSTSLAGYPSSSRSSLSSAASVCNNTSNEERGYIGDCSSVSSSSVSVISSSAIVDKELLLRIISRNDNKDNVNNAIESSIKHKMGRNITISSKSNNNFVGGKEIRVDDNNNITSTSDAKNTCSLPTIYESNNNLASSHLLLENCLNSSLLNQGSVGTGVSASVGGKRIGIGIGDDNKTIKKDPYLELLMNYMSDSRTLKKSSPSSIVTISRMIIEGRSALDSPNDTNNKGIPSSSDDKKISSTSATIFEPNKKMDAARLDDDRVALFHIFMCILIDTTVILGSEVKHYA